MLLGAAWTTQGGRLQFLDVELVRKKVMRIFEGKVLLSRNKSEFVVCIFHRATLVPVCKENFAFA